MNETIQKRVVDQFKSRVHAQTLGKTFNPKSKKHQDRQADFFAGAMAAFVAVVEQSPEDIQKVFDSVKKVDNTGKDIRLNELYGLAMPPSWVFGIMQGDDLTVQPKSSNVNK